MKKKVVPAKRRSVSGAKRTAPKRSQASQPGVITVQRIVIFSACVVLAIVGVLGLNRPALNQSVAGVSVARGLYAQTTVELPSIEGAVSYNIYYKKAGADHYDNAVRNISTNTPSYTIAYLKKGTNYEYQTVAVDSSGKEFWFSLTRPLSNLEGM